MVAVSINLTRIISVPGLPGRAFDALLRLLQVFFIASFAFIPGQPAELLATEILVIVAAFSLIGQMVSQSRYARLRQNHPRSWLVTRIAMGPAATLPFCLSGLMLLFGSPVWIYSGCFRDLHASGPETP